MSQVLLGVRNLSLRIAVVAVIAVLLVWFLGGNLLPRTPTIAQSAHQLGSVSEGVEVRLVQVFTPLELLPSEQVTFHIELNRARGGWKACADQDTLVDATVLVDVPHATEASVYFAGRMSGATSWTIYAVGVSDSKPNARATVTDRLEAERQLARLAAGLSLQTAEQSAAARDALLHAGDAPMGRTQ